MRRAFIASLVAAWTSLVAACSGKPPAKEKQWYEGGTLHRATMKEWARASRENKLATAADFMRRVRRATGKDEYRDFSLDGGLHRSAQLLVHEIDNANPDGLADDKGVSEVAATILVLEWKL